MPLIYEKLIEFDLLSRLQEGNANYFFEKFLELNDIISEINGIDKFIKETPSFPGSTDKIIRSEMNMAIGSTLAIEGIHLNTDEIEESFRKASLNETLQRKEREAQNSKNVYDFIIDTVNVHIADGKPFTFTEGLIRQIHKLFTTDLDYVGNTPGDYRGEYKATFGYPRREGICRNRGEVEQAMKLFTQWLNAPGKDALSQKPLVKAITAHFYLAEIHPFSDGNGRTARALEALILYLNGINKYCFWSLANFWSANRDEYIARLGEIRSNCDPFNFVEWGVRGYLQEVSRIKEKVLKKLKQIMLKDYTRFLLKNKKTQDIRINQRIVDVIDLLIDYGQPVPLDKFTSSPQVKALYKNVTTSTWYRDLTKMSDSSLIKISEKDDLKTEYVEPNFSVLELIRYNVK